MTLGLAVATIMRPARGLAAVLCLFGLKQWTQAVSTLLATNKTFVNYALAGIIVIGVVRMAMTRPLYLRPFPLASKLAYSLIGFAFVTYVWCVYPEAFVQQWSLNWPYVLMFVVLAPLLCVEPEDLYDGLVTTILMGFVITVLLLTTVSWSGRSILFTTDEWGNTIYQAAGNPLSASQMAGYVLLAATLMHFEGLSKLLGILRWVIVVCALLLIVRSGSRGQLFGTVAAVVVFLPLSRNIKNVSGFAATAAGIILVGAITIFFVDTQTGEHGTRWTWESMTDSLQGGRVQTSLNVLRYWAASGPIHWVLGLGNSASFSPLINHYYPEVHPAEILGEEGLIGFTLWCGMVVVTYRSILRLRKVVADVPRYRGLLAAAGALFTFEFFLDFKQGNMLGFLHIFTFAIIIGRFEFAIARRLHQEWEYDQAMALHQQQEAEMVPAIH